MSRRGVKSPGVMRLRGALESHPRLMADDVETKQRSITNMIADTNVVAAFESTDELAAATARVRESKSTGQKLHLRGRCRKLSRPETLERFCNTAARHGSASVEDVAGADDVPADMYDPADEVAYRIRTDRKARCKSGGRHASAGGNRADTWLSYRRATARE
jgi:hypothetical protein